MTIRRNNNISITLITSVEIRSSGGIKLTKYLVHGFKVKYTRTSHKYISYLYYYLLLIGGRYINITKCIWICRYSVSIWYFLLAKYYLNWISEISRFIDHYNSLNITWFHLTPYLFLNTQYYNYICHHYLHRRLHFRLKIITHSHLDIDMEKSYLQSNEHLSLVLWHEQVPWKQFQGIVPWGFATSEGTFCIFLFCKYYFTCKSTKMPSLNFEWITEKRFHTNMWKFSFLCRVFYKEIH